MSQHLIVPAIGGRNVACAEWPYIRRVEHFLKLLDLVNDAFNVHVSQSSTPKILAERVGFEPVVKQQRKNLTEHGQQT